VPAPTPIPPVPPVPPPSAIAIRAVHGLYLLDPLLPGEPAVEGSVQVLVSGLAPPAGTAVTLNGVPLLARDLAGLPRTFWSVDPAGAQPTLGADGALTIQVRAGGQSAALVLACPPDPGITTSTPVGASLGAAPALSLSWRDPLPENAVNVFPSDFYPVARLRGLDAATGAGATDVISQLDVPRQAQAVSLDVGTAGSGGYLAELSWPGIYAVSGGSGGFCGRLRRFVFAP
jgi:hypothetical protein